jgi:hypothetical protein
MTTQAKPAKPTTPMRRRTAPRPAASRRAQKRQPHLLARNRAMLALLDSWANPTPEEIQEQRETMEFLEKALDEDRPGYRKLFHYR